MTKIYFNTIIALILLVTQVSLANSFTWEGNWYVKVGLCNNLDGKQTDCELSRSIFIEGDELVLNTKTRFKIKDGKIFRNNIKIGNYSAEGFVYSYKEEKGAFPHGVNNRTVLEGGKLAIDEMFYFMKGGNVARQRGMLHRSSFAIKLDSGPYGGNENIAMVNEVLGSSRDLLVTCMDGSTERNELFLGDWQQFCQNLKGERGTLISCQIQDKFGKSRSELYGFYDFSFTFLVNKLGLYSENADGYQTRIIYDSYTGKPRYDSEGGQSFHLKLRHFNDEENIVYPSRTFTAMDGTRNSRTKVNLNEFGIHGQNYYQRIQVNYNIGGRYANDPNDDGKYAEGSCTAIRK